MQIHGLPSVSYTHLDVYKRQGYSTASKKVFEKYQQALLKLGTESEILREVPLEDIKRQMGEKIAEGISHIRKGEVQCIPGFDGEYGRCV